MSFRARQTVTALVAVAAGMGLGACSTQAGLSGDGAQPVAAAPSSGVSSGAQASGSAKASSSATAAAGEVAVCPSRSLTGTFESAEYPDKGRGYGLITLTNTGSEPCSLAAGYLGAKMLSMRDNPIGQVTVTVPNSEPEIAVAKNQSASLELEWPTQGPACIPPPAALALTVLPEDDPLKIEVNLSQVPNPIMPCDVVQITSLKRVTGN